MERLKKIIIEPGITIKAALKSMADGGERILFVAEENKLLGTITDGDIRKWILRGKKLNQPISKAMNRTPVFLVEGYSIEEAKNLMITNRIECLPIVNESKKIVSAIWWIDLFAIKRKKYKKLNMPVIIMAGGEGVRLSPFTKIFPKPLIPVGDKSITEVIFDRFSEYGCKEFYISVNYKANLIKAYFNDLKCNYKINYINEDKPLGTAGSLYLLKNKIKSAFCLSNCDVLIEADYADILAFHQDNKNKITIVGSVKHYTIPYGVCEIKNGGKLKSIKEKPEYDFLVNTGVYILEPEILNLIPDNQFYNTTDLINDCVKKGENLGVYPISEKSWLDMGQWEELQKMLNNFNIK